MQFSRLTFVAFLAATVVAADIDNDDIPFQCRTVCQQAVDLSRTCDQQFNDNDQGELNCQCTGQGASTFIPACEACVSTYDNDRSDNDVNDLLRSCSFTTTTFNTASADTASAGTASFTPTGTTRVTQTTTNPAGNTVVQTSTSVQGTVAGQTTTNAPTNTPNAAVGMTAENVKMGALVVGVVGVVLGLL